MFISIFDMFKIGIGPSSSHTLGPMKAGKAFVDELKEKDLLDKVTRVQANVYGSLSLTGIGHSTDKAILLGLAGEEPETVDIDGISEFMKNVRSSEKLMLGGSHEVEFPKDGGFFFHDEYLPMHENGMCLIAFAGEEDILHKTYYSVGGGFIVKQEDFAKRTDAKVDIPFPYASAAEMLELCEKNNMTLPELGLANELALRSEEEVNEHLRKVRDVMYTGIKRGSATDGPLPGSLLVPRRAAALRRRLEQSEPHDGLNILSWVNMFALAISEENASCGRVVTAPTNGACGVVPAVLAYYDKFVEPVTTEMFADYIFACNQIASLYKMNASISGAEVGCQGEVGVACSMAAGGLAQLMGATPEQVCIAAEIGMEHKLGLTCDPVLGQVQVPCIERNAVAAVDSITSARMALERESKPCVSLDEVIWTMYKTGKDMNAKYRETSQGGLALAVHPPVPVCG
ncbi:L-serine ammonia-lyase [Corynebacterium marquesiae]|uniref:L-serine ammonia-lyase n=1 Tax=Corynebacterium marquesiae TaxID=2913503 RepID=UPI00066EA3FA|nr:L-serine ammonia-lyase [Corynebacterium marquesiae]MCG7446928.1 L-serine ammonia-lyase [Corynebacterium aurimucosum]MCZ9299769.1 L-serine ammonia-lyase [Corynebacterium marquesiae]MDK8479490.1 L-serine ammonia-lyase [Corynebacterium marquesiae]MDK8531119.1 L-serine ammonia-lyase [Corynebacterium marquesiae]MDK8667296.1 L-serine ammonia-lyase [Corynebacterium marquesiae]